MIGTVIRIGWLNLRRDRVAQFLTFLLPVVFFTVFAVIFGTENHQGTVRIRAAVVDEDHSELSARLVAALERERSLIVRTKGEKDKNGGQPLLDRATARELVRGGEVPVAVVLPRGMTLGFADTQDRPKIVLLADVSDPIAPQMVQGLLQKVLMTAAPDQLMGSGITMFEKYAGSLTAEQKRVVDGWLPELKQRATGTVSSAPDSKGMGGLVPVEIVDVMREADKSKPIVSYFAAGIGVMFLLFMCSGAGGALIEEVESGTLERLLTSHLGMSRLLIGKWLYLVILGFLQLTVMFTWAALVFRIDLLGHLAGFAVMTLATAAAAGGFGLLLASACRTRAQLGGLSTVVILLMSAFGGSMFPRFLMPAGLQKAALVTFNAWALDGYLKVFWRDMPVAALWPQVTVLLSIAAAFLLAARTLARRWERA